MSIDQLERRLAALERAVARLNDRVGPAASLPHAPSGEAWLANAGRFADDPTFDEIVRLGREYRNSLRPSPDEPGADAA